MALRPERILERYPLVQDPPFYLDGTRAFLFVLPTDDASVDAMLARTFGWAAPDIVVQRLGSHCILVVTDTAQARTADPQLGHFAYREATFFVPVQGTRSGTPFISMHVPFIYPSEGLAVAAGREVFGLPKKQAAVSVPIDGDFWSGTSNITADILAARAFDGSAWATEQLLRVEAQPQGAAAAIADDVLDAMDAFFGPLPGHLLGQDLVQLKQVADVRPGGVPPRVLSRSIVHIEAPVSNFTNVRLGDASKVSVHLDQLESEPIRDVLGLPAVVTPTLAASLEMDFRFGSGQVWVEVPEPVPSPGPKTNVLILGGGLGALSTAFELTATEALRDSYDVRILCQGHLLGGKGASWRNRAKADRIEEHGLHVIFGFYHNFMRQFREVYGELSRPLHVDPSTFDEAFVPRDEVVFHDGTNAAPVTFPRTPAGYGAGPKSLGDQLFVLGSIAQSLLGGTWTSILGGLIPGGNPVARDLAHFVGTLARGVIKDVIVLGKSWEELDAQDFRDWMDSHKIIPGLDLRGSAIMQVPYDGVFSYRGGDQTDPVLGAGIAARGLVKLVTDYERAPFFEMTVGMGEAVFAPMLELLRARGVRVDFFSKVTDVQMSGSAVTKVTFERQADVFAGAENYDPFETVGTVVCFKQDPDPAQLDPGSPALAEDPYSDASAASLGNVELNVGADFDWVVCALPAPVTAKVLSNVAPGSPLLDIANIPTVATLHLQAWMNDHRTSLGWAFGDSVIGGFEQPLNSLQENTRLLGFEGWPPAGPRTLIYASGPFGPGWTTDPTDPAARTAAEAAAQAQAKTFTENELVRLYPGADDGTGKFDLTKLHAPWTPADPFADQYARGNIDLSARYVLCEPGTFKFRPLPEWQSASNLRLAGDWTNNGIDIPCMEGACISGMMAAASILGVTPAILV